MLIIHKDSHLDHNLTPAHVEFIEFYFRQEEGGKLVIKTLDLPDYLPALPCDLHGPLMGGKPVAEALVHYKTRGNRQYPSRMIHALPVESRQVTIIAGPHDGIPLVLFTAYGGPLAPREPGDPALGEDMKAIEESGRFWSEHALAE